MHIGVVLLCILLTILKSVVWCLLWLLASNPDNSTANYLFKPVTKASDAIRKCVQFYSKFNDVQHIKSRMMDLGWHIDEDQFEVDTPVGRRVFTNVVAVLDPRSPSRLTLACHYDSKQFANDVIESFVGATDSAASCAMIIHLVTCLNESLHQSTPLEVSTRSYSVYTVTYWIVTVVYTQRIKE